MGEHPAGWCCIPNPSWPAPFPSREGWRDFWAATGLGFFSHSYVKKQGKTPKFLGRVKFLSRLFPFFIFLKRFFCLFPQHKTPALKTVEQTDQKGFDTVKMTIFVSSPPKITEAASF